MATPLGTPVSLALACLSGLCLLVMFGSALAWVRTDARARGHRFPTLLAVVAVATSAGLLLYLLTRGPRHAPPTDRERLAMALAVAGVVTFAGVAMASPPDPLTQVLWFGPGYVVAALAAYLALVH